MPAMQLALRGLPRDPRHCLLGDGNLVAGVCEAARRCALPDRRTAAGVVDGAAERQRDADVDVVGDLDRIARRTRRRIRQALAPFWDAS